MSGQDLTSATEGPTPEPVASDVVAPARARRRAPRKDEVLMGAVDEARAGLAGLATPEQIGEHVGVVMDDDRLATHRFVSRLPGYRGWHWYATVARVPRSRHVTVCEVGLSAGEDSLVAPPWVPYAERVSQAERARMQAVAEGRDPNRPAPSDENTESEGSDAAAPEQERNPAE